MPRTVNEGFKELISRLQPLDREHAAAAKHKATVFSCLNKNFDCYNLKATGSFGNGTGVRLHSDSDYFAVCRAKTLPESSSYTLAKFRDSLQYTFPKTEVRVSTPAVLLPFGSYASENMEVVPTYFHGLISTPVGKKPYFSIPNYDGGWMFSSPDTHNAYVTREDRRLGHRLKPLIQLVKAWKYYNNAQILSFYLELRVTKYAEGEKFIEYPVDFTRVLDALVRNELAFMNDPMGVSRRVPSTKTDRQREVVMNKLNNDLERARKALDAYKNGKVDEAFRLWDIIFNHKFPAR